MNYFTKNALINSLKNRLDFIELNYNDSTIIVSEHGGRVLGIFLKEECINLLWINPAIEDLDFKKEWNIGGDRYWISPERLFFYKNPELWEDWFCPEGLDPAEYKFTSSTKTNCSLITDVNLTNQLTKEAYKGKITRNISLVEEPINTGVPYCGIQYMEDCTLFTPNLNINGWTLTQVISGGMDNPGTVLIPTNNNPKPQSYFNPIPSNHLSVRANYIAFKIDVNDIYKLGVRPEDIDFSRSSKMGYVLKMPESEEYGFLVKISNDIPKSQDECFDVSRDHPDAEIGVIQSYNSESPDKPFLNFGEIELQLNIFKDFNGQSRGIAKHQLFGYIGTKNEILGVIEKYLEIRNPILF